MIYDFLNKFKKKPHLKWSANMNSNCKNNGSEIWFCEMLIFYFVRANDRHFFLCNKCIELIIVGGEK